MSVHQALTQAEAVQRAQLISNVAYVVSLRLDADPHAKTFSSTTRVSFDWAGDGGETFIDLIADSVTSIELNSAPIPAAAFANDRITLTNLATGHNQLVVVANVLYTHSGVGLHRKVDPSDSRIYLYAHFEPYDAHRVFACFDQPDIKAPFTLDVEAPAHWAVASNQGWWDPLEGSHAPDTVVTAHGETTHTAFATTKPLPPYLTHLTAGEYVTLLDEHNGLPLFLMARQSQADVIGKRAQWIFERTKEGLDLFRRSFGFDYQFAQYGQAFVPEFNAGAMENPGCVTFNDLYISKGRPSVSQLRRFFEVILHEMAHVYGFGDVTTMTWWDDLHLNETFATLMAYYQLSKSADFADDAWLEFAQAEKTLALAQDQLPSTHPVKAQISSTTEVSQQFDSITYAKGACVIRQLLALIGDDAFFAGVRDYFEKHWFGNATQADFLNALSRASGRDLSVWGDEWMGKAWVNTLAPVIELDGSGSISALTVKQSASEKYPTLRTHRIGIGLYDLNSEGRLVRRGGANVEINGAATTITDRALIGQRKPDLLLLNDGDLTYAKVRFDSDSLATLREHVGDIVDPLARALVWTALWDMTRDAELPARQYVEMVVQNAQRENEMGIMERLLAQATAAVNYFCGPEFREPTRERLAGVARQRVVSVGNGSDAQLSWLRAYISWSQSGEQLRDIEAMLDGEVEVDGVDIANDVDLRWQIVMRLAAAGKIGPDRIDAEVRRDPSDVAQRRREAALASMPSPQAKAQAWEKITANPDDLPLATLRAICVGSAAGNQLMGGFNQAGQDALIEPYVAKYHELVPKLWATREEKEAEDITELLFPRYAISDSTLAATEALLKAGLPYSADRMLREARDNMQRAQRARALDSTSAVEEPVKS